jgi:hypothetical protein
MLETLLSGKKSVRGVNTLLLLQADKGFVDQAVTERPINKQGTVLIDGVQAKFSPVSFNCRSGGIIIPAASKQDLVFPAGQPYTIEFWTYNTTVTQGWWLSSQQSATSDLKIYSGNVYVQDESRSLYAPASYMTTGKWTHIAICSTGTTVRLFIDGKIIGVPFAPGGWSTLARNLLIGTGEVNSGASLDQIRISKIARYTAAFVPTETPFIID